MDNENNKTRDYDRNERRNMNWLPLLLLPVAFLLGWLTNDASKTQDTSSQFSQPGVGGGPETNNEVLSPSPSPTSSTIEGLESQ